MNNSDKEFFSKVKNYKNQESKVFYSGDTIKYRSWLIRVLVNDMYRVRFRATKGELLVDITYFSLSFFISLAAFKKRLNEETILYGK